jgi:hypothetical protein
LMQLFSRSTRLKSVRVEGVLHSVHASGHFTLQTEDGTPTHGMLSDSQTVDNPARFLGQPIVVIGRGTVLPGGELLFVFAEGLFPQLNAPLKSNRLHGQCPEVREEMANRLKQAIGSWPGNESDEELSKALEGLS